MLVGILQSTFTNLVAMNPGYPLTPRYRRGKDAVALPTLGAAGMPSPYPRQARQGPR